MRKQNELNIEQKKNNTVQTSTAKANHIKNKKIATIIRRRR